MAAAAGYRSPDKSTRAIIDIEEVAGNRWIHQRRKPPLHPHPDQRGNQPLALFPGAVDGVQPQVRAGKAPEPAVVADQLPGGRLGNSVIAVWLKGGGFQRTRAIQPIFRRASRLHECVTPRVENSLNQIQRADIVDVMDPFRVALAFIPAVRRENEKCSRAVLLDCRPNLRLLGDIKAESVAGWGMEEPPAASHLP